MFFLVLIRRYFADITTMLRAEEYVLASFNSLKLLHNVECDSLIKFTYRLSYKASTFEKQNVKLALQIFDKFTVDALSIFGEKLKIPQYGNTNVFIKIILICGGRLLM